MVESRFWQRLEAPEQDYNLQGANAYLGVIIPLDSVAGAAQLHHDHGGPTLSHRRSGAALLTSACTASSSACRPGASRLL